MLYDTVDHQWVNGVDQNAYSGFSDGTSIAHLIYGGQASDNGSGLDVVKYWTSRAKRTAYQSSVYAVVNMQLGKSWIGSPYWPGAWGTRNNLTLFASFWAKSTNAFQGTGGGDISTKLMRTQSTPGGNQAGTNFAASGSIGWCSNLNPGGSGDFRQLRNGNGGVWMRHDFWLDQTTGDINSTAGQLINIWSGVMGSGTPFHVSSYSGFGGDFNISHPADALYSPANLPTNSWWDPADNGMAFSNIDVNVLGYDDGHGLSAGNNYDIAELYIDPDIWRFEVSDSLTWDAGPTSTMDRENCGHWSRDSDTQCTVQLNFGQFPSSQTGLALWLVNPSDRQNAVRVCHN